MANTTWSSSWTNASDPQFRAWAGALSSALAAVGMVLVEASTVASAWGSVIAGYSGSTTNTEWAWEVWRFPTSAVQTASPVFLRIGYGTLTTGSAPYITIKVSASAGSGGVTTGIGGSDKIGVVPGSVSTATATPWYLSCDGHGLALFTNSTSGSASHRNLIVIDRLRGRDGDPLTDYGLVMLDSYGSRNAISQNVWDLATGEWVATTWNGGAPCITQGALSAAASNLNASGETLVYPWNLVTKNAHAVSKMLATYAMPDMAAFAPQPVRWLPSIGTPTDRTLLPLGSYLSGSWDWVGSSASPGASVAIWWSDP